MKPGVVYFARMVTGPIKIGFTTDLKSRASNLSMGVPGGVEIVASMCATLGAESWLHKQFARDNISGEWFEPSDDLVKFVADVLVMGNLTVPSELRSSSPSEALRQHVASDELTERVRFFLREIAQPIRAGEKICDQIKRAASIVGASATRTKDLWYGEAHQISASEYLAIKEAFDIKIAATRPVKQYEHARPPA